MNGEEIFRRFGSGAVSPDCNFRLYSDFLMRLGIERGVESVSEDVEGLDLHFICRPDFRMVKMGMIRGRNRKTVEDDVSLGDFVILYT